MVKSIINQGITDYGEDITTTDNPTTMTELMGRYPGMDRIQELQNLDYKNNPRDMATGTASNFRHAAAMNELSKSLSPGFVPDVVGDALAYGLVEINEIPDVFRGFSFSTGFDPQAKAAALEDLTANRLGTFGTPNTATIEDVFAKTLGYQAPGSTVAQTSLTGPFNYGTAQAAEVTPALDSPAMSLAEARAAMTQPVDIQLPNARTPITLGAIDPYQQSYVNDNSIFTTNIYESPTANQDVLPSEEIGFVGGIPDRDRS